MGLLNGYAVFGYATSFQPALDPTAEQINAFFGINGIQSLHGGERGFTMFISGVLFDLTPELVLDAESILLSYRDGVSRLLVDNNGTPWPNVIFNGTYQRWEYGVKPGYIAGYDVEGWAIPYKAIFRGLGG